MNNLFVVVLSVLAFFGIAGAYDFDDLYYNQILAQDFDDFATLNDETYVGHPRARRDEDAVKDEKCRKRRFRSCCDEDFFDSIHEQDKPLKKECYKQITGKEFKYPDPFKCDKVEKHKKEFTCVGQCAGQKKGVIDEEGNIKVEEVRKVMHEKLDAKEWLKPRIDELVDKCVSEAKEAAAKRDLSDKDTCNPSAIKFGFCVWREIQQGCPADRITDEKKCTKIREDMKKYAEFAHHPAPHHDDE